MADGASPTIPPRDAIALGIKYFSELMESQPKSRVLLEGVSLDGSSGNWIVTFGFDSERTKPARVSPLLDALAGTTSALRTPEVEILREFRSVHIDSSDGRFIKMEHA